MSAKSSRDVLDWFRSYANSKLTALGATVDASNMNVPLTNDTRVASAISWLEGREAELIAAWTADLEPWWQPAQDQVWSEINARMPANVRAGFAGLWADTDPNVVRLLKALMRVLCRLVQTTLAGQVP